MILSSLLKKFPEVVFGFSTIEGGVSPAPYFLNISTSVGDQEENVKKNREIFFNELGITKDEITFQLQIHSSVIKYSDRPELLESCDALYTDKKNNFLAVSVADCIPVFLYEPEKKVVACIHSGWKGTYEKITTCMIEELKKNFSIDVSKLVAYIGPGISVENYEVGKDLADRFNVKVVNQKNGKFFLDLKKDNFIQLINCGVEEKNIEVSEHCTFNEKHLLHSYRRDGQRSGRMFGIIGMR
ncbi:MAG: peptidoglycan editing factor PgeF [Ignavibacteria bacterium]